ncbi:SDR family NAD(P)-dependent oxidoreductase [Sphingomonas sp.]|uniref:SDR family NAD(P)-dependent oxidoreductase n=1 Tax=Sphingomonas sp. TaxID=28214 RepID=UPI003B005599
MTAELRLDGKVALVTGAGRGLGRTYALLLAERGASVVVNDLGAELDGAGRDGSFAASVVAEIEAAGGRAVANVDSVATEAGARSMVEQALDGFGGLHVVINNAGNFTPAKPFLDTSSDSFLGVLQVHLLGTVNVARAAWDHLVRQGYGRIINVGSHTGYFGHRGRFEYASAKGAVHGFTMSLAMEGEAHGIAVNLLAPGAGTRPVRSWDDQAIFSTDAFAPELAAPTALWLAHDSCDVSGQAIGIIAGASSRIVVAETKGYQSRSPTPEAIAAHRDAIIEPGDVSGSNLELPTSAVARGMELVERFQALPSV